MSVVTDTPAAPAPPAAAAVVSQANAVGPASLAQCCELDSALFTLHSQGAEAVSLDAGTGISSTPVLAQQISQRRPLSCFYVPPQRVWEGCFLERSAIVKQRFNKKYRHPLLDAKLTVSRLKQAGHLWLTLLCSAIVGQGRCTTFPLVNRPCFTSTAGSAEHDACPQAWGAHAR